MASSEKQIIPLEDIPVTNEDKPDIQQSSTKDLVDAKLPSRPRRKVVIIAVVIVVIIVVAVAGSLIGKYVPDYLSKANSKSEKDSKDKGAGEPSSSDHLVKTSALLPTKESFTTTTSSVKATSLLTKTTSIEERASPSGMSYRTSSLVLDLSSIAKLALNSDKTQTSPLPRMTPLTSAAATSSMSEATSIMSRTSGIILASSTV